MTSSIVRIKKAELILSVKEDNTGAYGVSIQNT